MKELAEHILDIANNSIRAKATLIEIRIDENEENDVYQLTIKDNGIGIAKEMINKVIDPFVTSRTTRKVGLGLPLLKQNTEQTGGHFSIESEEKKGTTVKAAFKHKNVDRPTIGDIAGVLTMLGTSNPEIDVLYIHTNQSNEYIFDTRKIKKELEGIRINRPEIIRFMKEMIIENLESINYTK